MDITAQMHSEFLAIWNKTDEKVEFNPQWVSETGYLDCALFDENVKNKANTKMAFIDTSNRKGIIFPEENGIRLLVFEQYMNGEGSTLVYHSLDVINDDVKSDFLQDPGGCFINGLTKATEKAAKAAKRLTALISEVDTIE